MRPNLAATREAEILDALEACVRKHGVGGLTTQRIAEESGYSRSHIRHYLGNKADQLQALINVYSDRYANSLEELVESAPEDQRRFVVLRELFGETWQTSQPEDDIILEQLNSYASSNDGSEPPLAKMYERILVVISDTLSGVLGADLAIERARLVLSLAYGVSSMMRLNVIQPEGARSYARQLMELPPE